VDISLRRVTENDLAIFFEHQRDEEAAAMAAFDSRDWDAFISHWHHEVLGNPAQWQRLPFIWMVPLHHLHEGRTITRHRVEGDVRLSWWLNRIF
jgi:hypothetical protein